jgi:hypothetical protein
VMWVVAKKRKHAGLEILMGVSTRMAVFWGCLMEAVGTSEMLVNSYQYIQCYNSEDSHLRRKHIYYSERKY